MKSLSTILLAVLVLALCAGTVQACPMCNQSIAAQENDIPRAFMYSILFMLGMPTAVFAGIGTAILLKFRNFYAAQNMARAARECADAAELPAAHELELAQR